MKRLGLMLLLAALGLGGAAHLAAGQAPNKLIVHEWGTFLTVQGSDGVSLGGMVDSEERLPPFVLNRGPEGWERTQARMRARMFSKMETPVTYFYVDQPMQVRVRVAMPSGLLTHWYPGVREMTPPWTKDEKVAPEAGSALDWGLLDVLPEKCCAPGPTLPAVKADDPWRFVRDVDAAIVRQVTGNPEKGKEVEHEKFLFYRGLGRFDLPLQVKTTEQNGETTLSILNRSVHPIAGTVAIEVRDGKIRFGKLRPVEPMAPHWEYLSKVFGPAKPLAEGVPQAKELMAAELVAAGLYPKEAAAMVNNWEHSYFATNGLRLLYVLPRPQTDGHLPIRIDPKPSELVRVMVGRAELLTPAREKNLCQALEALRSADPKAKAAAEAKLNDLGRLREPVLRRLAQLAANPADRIAAERLLSAGGE